MDLRAALAARHSRAGGIVSGRHSRAGVIVSSRHSRAGGNLLVPGREIPAFAGMTVAPACAGMTVADLRAEARP
jgi:hypothetical protein